MSVERVRQAVMAQAEAEAAKILAEAKAEAEARARRAREAGEAALEEAKRAAEASAAREKARQLSRVRHEGRLRVLAARNEKIDEVFRRAAEMLLALPEAEYLGVMEAWLRALPAGSGGVLRVAPKDVKRFSGAFLSKVNAARGEQGQFTGVEADPSVAGGFVVEGESFTANCTLARRLAELRESAAGDVAKELFGS
ncbi:MAG TPA: V-type ATP synthase subunit E family protein [Candidatus Brocadiia bacterium]|nr:V-type ATP synthase subunit E family protein [Candidatus Brocadiia bacterium]